jgi:hypothetical protein
MGYIEFLGVELVGFRMTAVADISQGESSEYLSTDPIHAKTRRNARFAALVMTYTDTCFCSRRIRVVLGLRYTLL